MSYPKWLEVLVRSDLVKTVSVLVEEFIVAGVILLGVTGIHGLLLRTEASDGFRELFAVVHEGTSLGTLTVTCVRSILLVGFRKLKH